MDISESGRRPWIDACEGTAESLRLTGRLVPPDRPQSAERDFQVDQEYVQS